MKNEIGRKITSLTLMTIMVAGGMTFAIPGILPEAFASHNANLFVSAENSAYDNYFAGPMVIEVIVNDPDLKTLDDVHGEPDVTINGNKLRVAQNTDGNWYGYFADRSQALLADSLSGKTGKGLDFGSFCGRTTTLTTITGGVEFSQTVGIAFPFTATGISNAVNGTGFGTPNLVECTGTATSNVLANHVIRENKTLNQAVATAGQIGLNEEFGWPIIQLYDFSVGGNVIIQYNKAGGAQSTTLTFDTVDQYAGVELDRTFYPIDSQIHITLTDLQLNIDPTDEDSWTWDGVGGMFYQLFTENGGNDAAFEDDTFTTFDTAAAQDISASKTALMFEVNGIVFLTLANDGPLVAETEDNDDQILNDVLRSGLGGNEPITFTELGVNTGIFGNYDESDNSNLDILAIDDVNTVRGRSALFEYGEIENSIVVGFGFATIDMVEDSVGGEWNSGEGISVILVDEDANKNTRADEDLDLFDPAVELIPTLKLGTPITLGSATAASFVSQTTRTAGGGGFLSSQTIGVPTLANTADTATAGTNTTLANTIQSISDRYMLTPTNSSGSTVTLNATGALIIDLGITGADLRAGINDPRTPAAGVDRFRGLNQLNYDIQALETNSTGGLGTFEILLLVNTTGTDIISPTTGGIAGTLAAISLANSSSTRSLINLNQSSADALCDLPNCTAIIGGATPNTSVHEGLFESLPSTARVGLAIIFGNTAQIALDTTVKPIVFDFFSTGIIKDGLLTSERINNQIIRIELEETGDNTSTFRGWFEYTMLSQINIFDNKTYNTLFPIDDYAEFIVSEDFTDEDSLRVRYNDLGADGVVTPVADQQEAPTHSGVVSFDASTYKVADTVIITLSDADLNRDVDIIDIYTTVDPEGGDVVADRVGVSGLGTFANGDPFGGLLFITFDDLLWTSFTSGDPCNTLIIETGAAFNTGLFQTGFTLIETGTDTGEFTGSFQIPDFYCRTATSALTTTTGTDIEVNYLDFRDASGEVIEVGDSAGVRANTGSVSLDRTVYPVPFGSVDDFTIAPGQIDPAGDSIFALHATGIAASGNDLDSLNTLATGDLQIHIRINDPDFDISAAGEDIIGLTGGSPGPVKITVTRGANAITLASAGANTTVAGIITAGATPIADTTIELGPIVEIAPDAGIFEIDMTLRYTDGPPSTLCPNTDTYTATDGVTTDGSVEGRFGPSGTGTAHSTFSEGTSEFCILQGDIITVEYTDPTDASGNPNTVTDSATFDLRNGVLQSDKSVYIIGGDLIMTLIEPDFDLDNDAAETYDLDLIEWDSDAATITMGDLASDADAAAFDPEPSDFRETGDSTGIFQIVIEIPQTLSGDNLERGEEVVLEYTDWGPSGADFVGDEDEDINLTLFTSNFGATVELDQKVYTWTDKVYITIVAPDHNFDSDLIDEIGESALDPIKVSTRGNNIDRYKLVETGTDTGIFTGEVILTGFAHDADGDGTDDAPTQTPGTSADGGGPTDGFLTTDDDDGITISFEFSEDETVIGSALIRWNIGETQWLEASYPASGTGVIRIIDPDMNLNPEAVDNFDVDVWSDSDAGGIDLTVTETNEATGIFEGTVFFTTTDESSGHRLRVAEGDTVTAEYEDNTLPDPYTTADELDITGTSLIGTIVPPLERAPAANARVVDAFGNALAVVSVDQQVQITADLANGQDRDQLFAYLVQVQDSNGVTISLAWITGSLAPGQSFSPALSWTPDAAGTYTATVFVWESVNNPTALSPPTSVDISVS